MISALVYSIHLEYRITFGFACLYLATLAICEFYVSSSEAVVLCLLHLSNDMNTLTTKDLLKRSYRHLNMPKPTFSHKHVPTLSHNPAPSSKTRDVQLEL